MSSKKKLTKARKAKQQREEEERKQREEEETLRQAEREEQERLERERTEELEALELKDQERREDELNELRHLLEENHTAVSKWRAGAAERAQWDRYMRCDGIPDPKVQQDINTYITLWRDDPEVNITPVLKQCNVALQLMEELQALLRETTDPAEAQKYQEGLEHLQELVHFKHLLASEEILKKANGSINMKTGNMQTVVRDDNMTLCLWANLSKSPSFKGLNFEEVGLGFELPIQLAVSNIAVRILHTRYDHLTMLAQRKTHTPSHRSLTGGDMEEPAGEEEVIEDTETQQQMDEEVKSIQGSEGMKSAASLPSRRSSGRPAESRGSQIETQMEALCAEGNLSSPLIPSAMDRSESVQVVDLQQLTPLGGVFYSDVFHLPPQACRVRGWEMRQLLNKGLQEFPHPVEESDLEEDDAAACSAVGLSVTLPDSVLFLETPHVARWDAAARQWRMDGITDVTYDEAESKLSFKMDSFQAFVLLQDTYINLPLQRWELRPLGQDVALLIVSGALMDLSITIQGDRCMLQCDEDRGLSHLKGKWMSGPALQRAMLNAGINIFVNEYTDRYVSSCGKDPLTEHAAYEQMALFASSCAFRWSKWNAKCGAEHLVMQACEHLASDPVPKASWSLYLLGGQRSQKLEMTEESDAFSPDHCPGSEFHSTFVHILQDDMSAAGIARTKESTCLFVDTVQSLLCASRPLVYSEPS